MADILGASTADLAALADDLRRTSADVLECRSSTTTAGTVVVENVTGAASDAFRQVAAHMQALRGAVARSQGVAESAQWTGRNRETFLGAHAQFASAMTGAEQATEEAFEQFRASIGQMAESLREYVGRFGTAMDDASRSVEGMESAVRAQLANLDAVMNAGLSAG